MNISNIQKKRFLDNLYKIYYTSGVIPQDQEVRKAFNDFFTVNRAGFPIRIDFDLLRATDVVDVEILNAMMANSLFNIDIIFDSIFENNEQLMGVVNALNKKLNNLKKRRVELESKIDDLLFSNSNTDGFFYSITENFASLNKIDLALTSGYIDVNKKQVELSSLNSENYNNLKVDNIFNSTPTASVSVNGATAVASVNVSNFSNVFDGLTDTYWDFEYMSPEINSVSLNINIPISSNIVVSRVQGVVTTTSPVNIYVIANGATQGVQSEVRTFESSGDYSTFSAVFPASNYSSIDIIMFKLEPDSTTASSSNPYKYKFGLRELIIGSKYYDRSGTIVSKPLSVPSSDNKNLIIDAVSLETKDQIVSGTDINYYVAADVPSATQVGDFNWIPISSSSSSAANFSSIVSFMGTTRESVLIRSNPSSSDLLLLPLNSASRNADEINPTSNVYSGKQVYRVANLNYQQEYTNPSLYGNIDSFKHYYFIRESTSTDKYKDLGYWSSEIEQNKANILNSLLKEQVGSIYPGIVSPSSGYIQTKLLSQSSQSLVFTISKTSYNFNLAVYLNGELLADLPNGVTSRSVEWNLIEGVNNIIITYDKPFSGVASFSLMEGTLLSRFGSIFVDYFYYLDPFDFANKEISTDNYFTIDKVLGRKQIFSSQRVEGISRLSYTKNSDTSVQAIRFRADLNRYENPYSTPLLQSYKIKFKHSSV